MLYFQDEYLREGVAMTVGETWREDLPKSGWLSSLLIRVSGNQVSGYGQDGGAWRLVDKISKIEVIANGATVIKSMTGACVQALAFYDQGVVSPDSIRNYATNTQYAYFLINFGRRMFDVEYGLDLSRFQNVELKITNTADGSSDFSSLSVAVMQRFLRGNEGKKPKGYFRAEEWRKWTTVADETQYLELPVEHRIRRIMLQAIPAVDSTTKVSKTAIYNLMDDIELALQTGVLRVFKGGLDDLLRLNGLDFGLPLTHGLNYNNADKGFDVGVGYVFGLAGISGAKDDAGSATVPTAEGDNNNNTQKWETYEADSPIHYLARGLGYHNTALFRFDYDPNDPAGLDPKADQTVQLHIHTRNSSDAASGTNRVVLDRLVV